MAANSKKKLRNKEKKRLEGKSHEEIPYQRMINIIWLYSYSEHDPVYESYIAQSIWSTFTYTPTRGEL